MDSKKLKFSVVLHIGQPVKIVVAEPDRVIVAEQAIEICQVKYLNNGVEQDHRFIKKITGPMLGFKTFSSAQATLDGIETAHMIRKGQLAGKTLPAYQQFINLAG